MSKKILITGASGFIGGLLYKELGPENVLGAAFNISESDKASGIKEIDLRDKASVKNMINGFSPDIIFHFAALVVPKINEENPELAKESHITVTENLLENAGKDTHIIFLSTDKVFDGSEVCPDEDAKTNPLSLYGKLKLEAEDMICRSLKKHHIFRLPIVHDSGDPRSTSFVDRSLIAMRENKKISAFTNVKRCYIKTEELIELLLKSVNNKDYGIYHVGCDMASYFDRIKNICDENGIKWEELLEEGKGDVFPEAQDLNRKKALKTFGIRFS